MSRFKYPQAKCPKCGAVGSDLKHSMLSRWHECKLCHERFNAPCSPHRHGESASVTAQRALLAATEGSSDV